MIPDKVPRTTKVDAPGGQILEVENGSDSVLFAGKMPKSRGTVRVEKAYRYKDVAVYAGKGVLGANGTLLTNTDARDDVLYSLIDRSVEHFKDAIERSAEEQGADAKVYLKQGMLTGTEIIVEIHRDGETKELKFAPPHSYVLKLLTDHEKIPFILARKMLEEDIEEKVRQSARAIISDAAEKRRD